MTRSMRASLAVAIVVLAVPSAALATHHQASHVIRHAPAAPAAAAMVTGYSGGTLTLALAGGGTITGAVTSQTRFVCIRTPPVRGRGFTPPPPCDSSMLVGGQELLAANVRISQTGVDFSAIVLLPAVQVPVTS